METRNYIGSVTRDNVFYYDGHYLSVKQNRHDYTRAPANQLYDLLTWIDKGPVLTKKGAPAKRQPPPHKDETAAYYTAQQIHYGLKPFKTKPAAKRSLLAAFGDGQDLKVPEHIKTMEKELGDLWHTENEEGRVRHEQEKKGKEDSELSRSLEPLSLESDEDGEPAAEVAPARRGKKVVENGKAVAQKKSKANGGNASRKLPELEYMGKFEIDAPHLAEQWDAASDDLKLTISPSGTGKHLWCSFDFGIVTGIFRCGAPPKTIGGTVAFKWRGYEQGEGQMQFDAGNEGTLTFLGKGKIRGTMKGGFMGKFTFAGIQDQETLRHVMWSKHVKNWKAEWRGINERSYDAASVSRWGGWSGNRDYTEKAAESDTTAIGGDSEDDEDGYDEAW